MHNQLAQRAKCPTRKINEAVSAALKKQLKQFKRLFDGQPSLQDTENNTFYLVSVRFIDTWQSFCLSQEQERELLLVMNEDLLQPGTQKLRPNLVEKEDFEIVSEDVWTSFGTFRANEIKRGVVGLASKRRVPIYLNQYRYLILNAKLAKNMSLNTPQLKVVEESQNATVEQLAQKMMQIEQHGSTNEGRLWRVDNTQSLESFLEHVQQAVTGLQSFKSLRIKGFGKRLMGNIRLEQAEAVPGWLVLQVRSKVQKWFLFENGDRECQCCYNFMQLNVYCKCNNAAYCSEKCRYNNRKSHMKDCQFADMEEFSHNFRMEIGEGSRRGKVGLRNLGNTCFINSCLQCLSNTRPFTDYFLQRLFLLEINISNPLGTKGKLARCYAMFIKAMWCERNSVHSPEKIKNIVSQINPIFAGQSQQDSQEFFSFLIDGLHEDLNRIEKKPYKEAIYSSVRIDAQAAAEYWLEHVKNNQSIITDLMTGQYKSKVICSTCQHESITFDPFTTLTIPIPQQPSKLLECYFFSYNFKEPTRKISFRYDRPNVVVWKGKIAKITGKQMQTFHLWLVTISEGIYLVGRHSLSEIIFKIEQEKKRVFVFEMSEQEQSLVDPIYLTVRLAKKIPYHTNNEYENLWFKFPLMAQRTATGFSLTQRLLQFLYPTAYTDRNSTSYPAYEKMMLQNRPFQLVLLYKRKVKLYFYSMKYQYMSQMMLDDETSLEQLSEVMKDGGYELDVRLNEFGISIFDIRGIKKYKSLLNSCAVGICNWENSMNGVELHDCFNRLSEDEEMQTGNEWYCPHCKERKKARKIIQIYKAPKVVILHLKRFKDNHPHNRTKNETRVHFPQVLDLSPFLIDQAPIASYGTLAAVKAILIPPKHNLTHDIPCSQHPIYDLYAISNHQGGYGGGHYTTYAKIEEKWYHFNDSAVKQIKAQRIQGSSAYMLFYMRRDK